MAITDLNAHTPGDTGQALPGHFYAIGIGPGAADLLTIRAAGLIESADVIIAPRSGRARTSLALDAVQPLLSGQEILDQVFPMQRDTEKTVAYWSSVAKCAAERCCEGKSVVQITLGDPLIYSTSCYLLAELDGLIPAENVHVVPGISAFQAAAGRFGDPLTIQEDRMLLMTATDLARVADALDACETLVLYKAGKKITDLANLLEQRGLLDRARLVCYAEQGEREFISHNLRDAAEGKHGYMATVIVHVGRKHWNEGRTSE